MTTEQYQQEIEAIQAYLSQATGSKPTEFNMDSALLASGILDSLGVVQLMAFLADSMGVEVSDEDFTLDNFETVGSLARFVAAKRGNLVA